MYSLIEPGSHSPAGKLNRPDFKPVVCILKLNSFALNFKGKTKASTKFSSEVSYIGKVSFKRKDIEELEVEVFENFSVLISTVPNIANFIVELLPPNRIDRASAQSGSVPK